MATAECACGALKLTVNHSPKLTALCHCLACQRRTGAAFSCNAFYAIECVEITGLSNEFTRIADSGRKVCMHFCPNCGSTVYWKAEAAPSWIGVAVGAFADPSYSPPALSVFEHSKHLWIMLDDTVSRFSLTAETEN
jgi:hypothetical protein